MVQEAASGDEMDNESTSDSELSEGVNGIQNELESFDTETDVGKNKTPSALTKAILAAPMLPASKVLDKWVQEGNKVNIREISKTTSYLRRQRLFIKALQLSDWTVSIGHLELTERKYASRVDLIAKVCDCVSTIEAWGKLKRIKDAEAIFEQMLKIVKQPSAKHYTVLLNIYSSHNMLAEAKDLTARMAKSGVTDFRWAWEALVKLYVRAGEVMQAESILERYTRRRKPFVTSYLTILDHYANRGDVHNAEKVFLRMKQVGFPIRIRSYRSLLHAYVYAKTPAYGFAQRMEADKIIPDKALSILLARASAVRNSDVAKLME
ncbi:hypothetical protein ACS0TY_031041 [Phlomoides rotata]